MGLRPVAPGWAWWTAAGWVVLAALTTGIPDLAGRATVPVFVAATVGPAALLGAALGRVRAWPVLGIAAGAVLALGLTGFLTVRDPRGEAGDSFVLMALMALLVLLYYALPLLVGACVGWLWRILRDHCRAEPAPLGMRTGPSPGNLDTWPTIN